MDVTVNETDGVLTATLSGRLDTAASARCSEELQPLFDHAGGAVALDCRELEFISSSGLRIFLSLLKEVNARKGSLKILNMNEDVHNIFVLTGFAKRFNI